MAKFISKNDLGIGLATPLSRLAASIVMAICGFNRANELLSDFSTNDTNDIVSEMLKRLDIAIDLVEGDANKIPKSGSFIAIANYPHGLLDILIMAYIVKRVRPDARFLIKNELFSIPFASELSLVSSNEPISATEVARKATAHLNEGHPLIVFPAERVASYSKGFTRVVDEPWNEALFKLARLTGAPMHSYFIDGVSSRFYLTLRRITSSIGSAMLVKEMFSQQFSDIKVAISDPFSYAEIISKTGSSHLSSIEQNEIVSNFVRALTFSLQFKIEQTDKKLTEIPLIPAPTSGDKNTLLEQGAYSSYTTDTALYCQKNGTPILCCEYQKVARGEHMSSHWFRNFDLSRVTSLLTCQDSVEIFNTSYTPEWDENDVKFISESLQQLAITLGVKNIVVQDFYYYYFSQSSAYAMFRSYLETNCAQATRNTYVVPRAPSSSLKPVAFQMEHEALKYPTLTLFAQQLAKVLPFEISPLPAAVILAGGKFIASATPINSNAENSIPNDKDIAATGVHSPSETVSQSVNLFIVTL